MKVPREGENGCVREASNVGTEGSQSHEAMEQEQWRCVFVSLCPARLESCQGRS